MQRLHVDGWRGRVRSRLRPEHPSRPLQELSLPGHDLVGMDIELLGQFGQRLLAPHGSQSHLRFESRRVVPAWSSAHRFSCSAAILAAVRQKTPLIQPVQKSRASSVHGSASAALRDNHLSAHPLDSMLLPRNDDSEARWQRSRRFSLRVRSRSLFSRPVRAHSGSHSAADLPRRVVAPAPYVAVPVFTWTGFYVGVNAGYGFSNSDNHGLGSFNAVPGSLSDGLRGYTGTVTAGSFDRNNDGFVGGGQIGYNYQMGSWVVGIEADLQFADMNKTDNGGSVVVLNPGVVGFVGARN